MTYLDESRVKHTDSFNAFHFKYFQEALFKSQWGNFKADKDGGETWIFESAC